MVCRFDQSAVYLSQMETNVYLLLREIAKVDGRNERLSQQLGSFRSSIELLGGFIVVVLETVLTRQDASSRLAWTHVDQCGLAERDFG